MEPKGNMSAKELVNEFAKLGLLTNDADELAAEVLAVVLENRNACRRVGERIAAIDPM